MSQQTIIEPSLSYFITGICFKVQKTLGRFCRERQYGDEIQKLFDLSETSYMREFKISNLGIGPEGNKVDFLVQDRIILEIKAKNFITKEDYYQTQRYLRGANLHLGLLVNFREAHLKPKRVLNSNYHLGH